MVYQCQNKAKVHALCRLSILFWVCVCSVLFILVMRYILRSQLLRLYFVYANFIIFPNLNQERKETKKKYDSSET